VLEALADTPLAAGGRHDLLGLRWQYHCGLLRIVW
jgi:hypothetical protein